MLGVSVRAIQHGIIMKRRYRTAIRMRIYDNIPSDSQYLCLKSLSAGYGRGYPVCCVPKETIAHKWPVIKPDRRRLLSPGQAAARVFGHETVEAAFKYGYAVAVHAYHGLRAHS